MSKSAVCSFDPGSGWSRSVTMGGGSGNDSAAVVVTMVDRVIDAVTIRAAVGCRELCLSRKREWLAYLVVVDKTRSVIPDQVGCHLDGGGGGFGGLSPHHLRLVHRLGFCSEKRVFKV